MADDPIVQDYTRVDAYARSRHRVEVLNSAWRPVAAGAAGATAIIAAVVVGVWVAGPRFTYREVVVPKIVMQDTEVPHIVTKDVPFANHIPQDKPFDNYVPHEVQEPGLRRLSAASAQDERGTDARGI